MIAHQFFLHGFFLSLIISISAVQAVNPEPAAFAIVGGTVKNSSIAILNFDAKSGNISLEASSLAGGIAPSFMAWRFGKQVQNIYVGNIRANPNVGGGVTAVSWDFTPSIPSAANISLLESDTTAIPDASFVTVHRSGKWAVITSTGNSTVSVVPLNIDPTSGNFTSFGPAINLPDFSVGNYTHEGIFAPNGIHFFITARDSDWIRMMNFNPLTGALTDNGVNCSSTVGFGADCCQAKVPAGSGPRHMVLHPYLPFAYVVNEAGNTVAAFDYDRKTGRLSANFEMEANRLISTLPLGAPVCATTFNAIPAGCKQSASQGTISPDGRFFYAANRGEGGGVNNIAIFSIGLTPKLDLGLLTPIGYVDADGDINSPRHMSLSPGVKGEFLLVANNGSNTVTVFSRNFFTGMLTKVMTLSLEGVVGGPSFVAVVHPNTRY